MALVGVVVGMLLSSRPIAAEDHAAVFAALCESFDTWAKPHLSAARAGIRAVKIDKLEVTPVRFLNASQVAIAESLGAMRDVFCRRGVTSSPPHREIPDGHVLQPSF